MIELTKDADKLLCYIYKEYLEKIKLGNIKTEANHFDRNIFTENKILSKCNPTDLDFNLLELGQNKLVTIYIGSTFELTTQGIIYMESRFENKVDKLTDFIAKFI